MGLFVSLWSSELGLPGQLTLHNYILAIQDPRAPALLANTAVFTVGAAAGATALGIVLAWSTTSTDMPLARFLFVLPAAPVLLPGLLKETAWIELYSPRSGLVNFGLERAFHLPGPLFNIYSMLGMIAIMALTLTPVTYFVLVSPIAALGRSLEEASRIAGAGRFQTLVRIVVPAVGPAIFSALALSALLAATTFETPILIGLPGNVLTYISVVYQSLSGSSIPNYNLAAADTTVYLITGVGLLAWYLRATRSERRFAVVTGRDYVRARARIGRWRWVLLAINLIYFLLAFLQLVGVTALVSLVQFYTVSSGNPFQNFTLDNYRVIFTTPDILKAASTSLLLAAEVSVLTTCAATLIAVIALKSRLRFRRLLEVAGTLPLAVPPFVFSIYLLMSVLFIPGLVHTYATPIPLVVADVVVFLPFAIRILSGAVIQLHDEFTETARVCGSGVARSVFTVLPLLSTALLSSAVLVFAFSFRELGAVVLLIGPNTSLLPPLIFSLWGTGEIGSVAVLNILSFGISAAVLGASTLLASRFRVHQ